MGANHVELRAPSRGLRLKALLGDGTPTPSGAVGGWEVVGRPRRRPLTLWRGTPDPIRLTIPMMLDGWPRESVEQECQTLMVMGGLDGKDREPPELVLDGPLLYSVDRRPNWRWVIESLEWGEALRRDDGARVRQIVTVNLLVPEDDDRIKRLKPRKGGDRAHTVHAPKGSTYEKLAAHYLGSKRYGGKLAHLNGARSPDHPFDKPRKVKLPSNAQFAEWKRDLKQ